MPKKWIGYAAFRLRPTACRSRRRRQYTVAQGIVSKGL